MKPYENSHYESANREKRESAENFVYSCINDMMAAKKILGENVKQTHTYNYPYSEFAYLLSLAPEIRKVAEEENIEVDFTHNDKDFIVVVKQK